MTKEAIYARLDELGVPYTRYEHEAAHTMEACYALPFAAKMPAVVCAALAPREAIYAASSSMK